MTRCRVPGFSVAILGLACSSLLLAGCATSPRAAGETDETRDSARGRDRPANLPLRPAEAADTDAPARRLAVRVTDAAIADDFNNLFATGNVYLAGWPTEQGLSRMAERGVKRIIALKTPEEVLHARGYDPRKTAERLGMELIVLPIRPDTYSSADVELFAKALGAGQGPVLIHCGTASTCAMVWSGHLATKPGATAETVMEEARAAGLLDGPMTEAADRVAREIVARRNATQRPLQPDVDGK